MAGSAWLATRQALHASRLSFRHPVSDDPVSRPLARPHPRAHGSAKRRGGCARLPAIRGVAKRLCQGGPGAGMAMRRARAGGRWW